MAIRILGGRIIDPSRGIDHIGDILIAGNAIAKGPGRQDRVEVIDAKGLWVVPGLIDAHVHLREPGEEHKETIATGLAAAAAGGFTAVLAMPNTQPPNDSPELTHMLIERAETLGGTNLYPVPAVTEGRRGQRLAPLADLHAAGAVAFSDDGNAVLDNALMEQALRMCRELDVPLSQHAEDPHLSKNGVIHLGEVSAALKLPGWPVEAEERIVARDIQLAEKTGGRLHFAHLSTKGSVDLIRAAKDRGVSVTAEVTPHHLHATDEIARSSGALAKVNPPLRPREHVEALRAALADGTIDIVATDHAPHRPEDKNCSIEQAAFGIVGLETAVGLMLLLVNEGVLTPSRMIEAMSTDPARVFGLRGGTLTPGAMANVTLIDPNHEVVIEPSKFISKGRNTPFGKWRVPGCVVQTIVHGRTCYKSSRNSR